MYRWGFPGGSVVKNQPANAGDMGLIPGLGGSRLPRSNQGPRPQVLSLCSRAGALQQAVMTRSPRPAAGEWPPRPARREKPTQQRRPGPPQNK